jgi:hypothetical protein
MLRLSWVRASEPSIGRAPAAEFTARLTIDVTPAFRSGIKGAASQRDLTVADMPRACALPDRKFPEREGAAPRPCRRRTPSRI